ncbi:MAG: iduronate 2-sulfatase [Saprospiraceae bacterium]|jgi:iduronate 2-sulfatase
MIPHPKTIIRITILATAALLVILNLNNCSSNQKEQIVKSRPNVLFIAIDDLRPELGVYGNKIIKTPNIDALGMEGVVFERTFVQQAVCNPSRASIMTGLRPDATKIWDLWSDFRDSIPDVITLPQYFKNKGYHSAGIGKIYHNIFPDTLSWSEPKLYLKQFPFDPDAYYVEPENIRIQNEKIQQFIDDGDGKKRKDPFGHYYVKANATEITDLPDDAYYDGAQTTVALSKIEELTKSDKPFFFGLGYYRPHLPFNAPRKYWDLYDPSEINLAENNFLPENAPFFSVNNLVELKGYTDFKNSPTPLEGSLSKKEARKLKHGYYASVSYVDALIGKVVAKLKQLDIYDNTIIVLWGDHGYKLGEHNSWTKFTNYKIDNHAPLIIKSHIKAHNQKRINHLTEFVDIYPTLCELAGLETGTHLEGLSLVPLMSGSTDLGKEAVFFQFLKESRWAIPEGNEQMGYSILTDEFHYISWIDWKTKAFTAHELYNLKNDPLENRNISGDPESAAIVKVLEQQLKDGWVKEKERIVGLKK